MELKYKQVGWEIELWRGHSLTFNFISNHLVHNYHRIHQLGRHTCVDQLPFLCMFRRSDMGLARKELNQTKRYSSIYSCYMNQTWKTSTLFIFKIEMVSLSYCPCKTGQKHLVDNHTHMSRLQTRCKGRLHNCSSEGTGLKVLKWSTFDNTIMDTRFSCNK